MKIRYMAFCSVFFYLLFVILSFEGCKESHTKNNGFTLSLKMAYQKLWLTKGGLEYPPRQEILERCKKSKDSCFKTYRSVQEGKKALLSKILIDPERALSFTLDTICVQCEKNIEEIKDKNKALEAEGECLGAITALFFFYKDGQDRAILDRLLKQSSQVLSRIARHRCEWFHNRPKPERWIEAIEKLPDDQLEQWKKETIIEELKKNIKDIEKFGIML